MMARVFGEQMLQSLAPAEEHLFLSLSACAPLYVRVALKVNITCLHNIILTVTLLYNNLLFKY